MKLWYSFRRLYVPSEIVVVEICFVFLYSFDKLYGKNKDIYKDSSHFQEEKIMGLDGMTQKSVNIQLSYLVKLLH